MGSCEAPSERKWPQGRGAVWRGSWAHVVEHNHHIQEPRLDVAFDAAERIHMELDDDGQRTQQRRQQAAQTPRRRLRGWRWRPYRRRRRRGEGWRRQRWRGRRWRERGDRWRTRGRGRQARRRGVGPGRRGGRRRGRDAAGTAVSAIGAKRTVGGVLIARAAVIASVVHCKVARLSAKAAVRRRRRDRRHRRGTRQRRQRWRAWRGWRW